VKINWGTLGISIGLILVATSILAMGLMVERRISALEKNLPIIEASIKRTLIAQEYAFGKADSERRAITLEDLKEGYALADKFMRKQP
jgi:hypothetical protein